MRDDLFIKTKFLDFRHSVGSHFKNLFKNNYTLIRKIHEYVCEFWE